MIRYRKLAYVDLVVSDLDCSRAFYTDVVGLEPAGARADGGVLFRCDDDPYSLVLHEGPVPGLRCAGWTLEDAAQLDALHAALDAVGVPHAAVPAKEAAMRGLGQATRFVEPNTGATLEFSVRSAASGSVFTPSHTVIQRLGHVVFNTPHRVAAITFFRDVLNFRESDSIGEGFTFLRPFPSPYHHGIGIARNDRNLLNHVNFMVTAIDDIGRAANRLKAREIPVLFGPGRHPASGSVFLYFLEPDGMTLEYSFGMEEFDEIDPRPPKTYPFVPESFDLWGGSRDPRFGSAGALLSATA